MKIALIIERANIALGGAERSIFELAAALTKLGHHVTVLAATGRSSKYVQTLCRQQHTGRTSLAAFGTAIQNHLAQNHYDILHSTLPFEFADIYQPRGGTYPEAILRNAASYEKPAVQWFKQFTAFANRRRAALLKAERTLARNAHGPLIVAISQYVAEQFDRHYTTARDRIVVIPNGVKIRKSIDSARVAKLRTQIFERFGLEATGNPALFLFVANNFRLKGLAALLQAWPQVPTFGPKRNCLLLVAGNGRPKKYRRLAARLGITDRVLFLGPLRGIQNALAIADVAVLPTYYDPASRFILEALAAGKPVITTRFNGATDLFVNDRHGKVIDSPQNLPALAQAIAFFSDPDNCNAASQAIHQDNLLEKISVATVAQKLISLYESILQTRAARQ